VNGFDLVFMMIYGVYLGARTYGFHYKNADALSLGADWLAIGASSSQQSVLEIGSDKDRSSDDVSAIGLRHSCQ